jgi:iron(III) transport system permease protein
MAKQPASESMDLALKGESARAGFSLGVASHFDVASVVMICVSVVTGYLVLPPLYSVIQTSLFTTKLTGEIDQFTLRFYEDLFRELQIIGPFLNTLYFSIGSAVFATLLGGSIAWIVVRTDSPLRGLGYFTAFASFGTPFILYTIGWLLLLGRAGPVNYWLKILFDQTTPVLNVYSLFGMIMIESLLWSPFVFLMLAAAFRSMDPSLEEASAACGARVWQTMRRISLRLMLPAFFSVMLLIFIRSFEAFEIPALTPASTRCRSVRQSAIAPAAGTARAPSKMCSLPRTRRRTRY